MKTKMIVFGEDTAPAYPKLESIVTDSFSAITGADIEYPVICDTVEQGLPEIASALKTSDIIAVFSDERNYHEAKRLICKAFKFEMIHNEKILENLKKLQNTERYMMHSLIPKSATPFALSDGLFSGFAIRSKSQCILFLPLSEDRTLITMKKYVFPYLNRIYGLELPNFGRYEIAYAADILQRQLIMTNYQIALANTPVCKYIVHGAKKVDSFNDHISYAPYDEKNADKSTSELSAVRAAEYYECPIGASVCEGARDKDGCYNATITISHNSKAKIRTFSSLPDENHEDFMNTAVVEFFLMLAEELSSVELRQTTDAEPMHVKPHKAVSGLHIILYILLFVTTFFFTYVASSFAGLPMFS